MAFQRILVPFDFSEHASEACKVAKHLALKAGAALELVHVAPPMITYQAYADLSPPEEFTERFASNAREFRFY